MLKYLLAGVWGAAMVVAGLFVGQSLTKPAATVEEAKAKTADLQQVTTELTGAPIIADGKVLGYLVFRIKSTVNASKLPNSKFDINPFLVNAAFLSAYGLYQSGFQTIEPGDFEKLTKGIATTVNQKLGPDTVQDVELEQFNYVPMDKVRQNIFSPK